MSIVADLDDRLLLDGLDDNHYPMPKLKSQPLDKSQVDSKLRLPSESSEEVIFLSLQQKFTPLWKLSVNLDRSGKNICFPHLEDRIRNALFSFSAFQMFMSQLLMNMMFIWGSIFEQQRHMQGSDTSATESGSIYETKEFHNELEAILQARCLRQFTSVNKVVWSSDEGLSLVFEAYLLLTSHVVRDQVCPIANLSPDSCCPVRLSAELSHYQKDCNSPNTLAATARHSWQAGKFSESAIGDQLWSAVLVSSICLRRQYCGGRWQWATFCPEQGWHRETWHCHKVKGLLSSLTIQFLIAPLGGKSHILANFLLEPASSIPCR